MNQFTLPTDKFQRYRQAIDLALNLLPRDAHPLFLDVGANEGLLERFVPHSMRFQVDLEFHAGQTGLILADAEFLPFPDDTFDVVFSIDLMEHLEMEKRWNAVKEMNRVARTAVVHSFPVQSELAVDMERLLNRVEKRIRGQPNEFLEQHQRYGLVDLPSILTLLGEHFEYVVSAPNFHIYAWLVSSLFEALVSMLPGKEQFTDAIHHLINRNFYRCYQLEPAYRMTVVGSHKPIPDELPVSPLRGSEVVLADIESGLLNIFSILSEHDQYARKLERDLAETRRRYRDPDPEEPDLSSDILQMPRTGLKASDITNRILNQYKQSQQLVTMLEDRITNLEQRIIELMTDRIPPGKPTKSGDRSK
ncbi:methyltransferase domain-containing protein [bacterium]|nr:methyltransferase domain-containing protein [candidate division CSSED10-310 bacterium]